MPPQNATEVQVYISVSPPPILRWLAPCCYWILLICAPPSPIFACQKTTEVSKILQRHVRDLSAPGTPLTASLVSTVMQVVPVCAGWGENWKSHQEKQESRAVVGSRSSGAFASQLWQGRCSNPELGRSQLGPWLIEILIKKRPLPSILRATYLVQINILTSVIKCATSLGGGWRGAGGRGKHLMQWNMHIKA